MMRKGFLGGGQSDEYYPHCKEGVPSRNKSKGLGEGGTQRRGWSAGVRELEGKLLRDAATGESPVTGVRQGRPETRKGASRSGEGRARTWRIWAARWSLLG